MTTTRPPLHQRVKDWGKAIAMVVAIMVGTAFSVLAVIILTLETSHLAGMDLLGTCEHRELGIWRAIIASASLGGLGGVFIIGAHTKFGEKVADAIGDTLGRMFGSDGS